MNIRYRQMDRIQDAAGERTVGQPYNPRFVAASEHPVPTSRGPEYLLVDRMALDRFKSNPVILDTHNRKSIRDTVARGSLTLENDKIILRIDAFAPTDLGKEAEALVAGDFLRGASVGFDVLKAEEVPAGATRQYGHRSLKGPCVVITQSELVEISLTSTPADVTSLKIGRSEGMSEQAEPAKEEVKEEQTRAAAPVPAVSQRNLVEEATRIRSIAPRGMEALADLLILEEATVEKARSAFKEELNKRMKPADFGTAIPVTERAASSSPAANLLSKEQILAAFQGE